MENINYGEYFRLLLKLYKISQAELGEYIGLSQRQISRYITNEGSYKSEYLSKILSGIEDIANDLINPYRYEGIDNGKALIKLELPKNKSECEEFIRQLNQKIEHNDTFQIEDVHSEEYQAFQHRWYLYQKISDIWMEIAAEKILYWNKMRDYLLDTEVLEISFIESYRLMPPSTQNIIDSASLLCANAVIGDMPITAAIPTAIPPMHLFVIAVLISVRLILIIFDLLHILIFISVCICHIRSRAAVAFRHCTLGSLSIQQ